MTVSLGRQPATAEGIRVVEPKDLEGLECLRCSPPTHVEPGGMKAHMDAVHRHHVPGPFDEEDKWVVNPARRARMLPNSDGGTTGMGSAKAVPANTEARSTSGGLARSSGGTDLPVAADDIDRDPPWGSLLIVTGTMAGAGLAVLGWWFVGRWVDARINRGSR